MSTRKGLVFSMDYTIAMLLFMVAMVVSLKLLINTYTNQEFNQMYASAERTSDMLVTPGYPHDWDNETLFQIGLTTRSNINVTKLRALYNMDPEDARKYLRTRYEYFIALEDKDKGIVYFNSSCGYGSDDVWNNGSVVYDSVAYYYPQLGGDTYLRDHLYKDYNMSIYYRNAQPGTVIDNFVVNGSLYNLTQNLRFYNTLILENPEFDIFSQGIALTEIARVINDWVSEGNVLLLSGRVGISDLTRAVFPVTEDGTDNATIVLEHPDIWFAEDERILFSDKYTVQEGAGIHNFQKIANYTNGEVAIATWEYGEGKIIYFADIQALYDNGAYSNISHQVNYTLSRTALGYCEGLEISAIKMADNLVVVDRFVVFNDRISKLVLMMWDK